MKDYYSPAEVASMFRVQTKTVAEWSRKGLIAFERVGSMKIYTKESIDRYLEDRRRQHDSLRNLR